MLMPISLSKSRANQNVGRRRNLLVSERKETELNFSNLCSEVGECEIFRDSEVHKSDNYTYVLICIKMRALE